MGLIKKLFDAANYLDFKKSVSTLLVSSFIKERIKYDLKTIYFKRAFNNKKLFFKSSIDTPSAIFLRFLLACFIMVC